MNYRNKRYLPSKMKCCFGFYLPCQPYTDENRLLVAPSQRQQQPHRTGRKFSSGQCFSEGLIIKLIIGIYIYFPFEFYLLFPKKEFIKELLFYLQTSHLGYKRLLSYYYYYYKLGYVEKCLRDFNNFRHPK